MCLWWDLLDDLGSGLYVELGSVSKLHHFNFIKSLRGIEESAQTVNGLELRQADGSHFFLYDLWKLVHFRNVNRKILK